MIFYFSATGNSRHVAQRLAAATGDRAVAMTDALKEGMPAFRPAAGERVGLVSPVYFFGLPVPVLDFVNALRVEADKDCYVYYVSTYGTSSGMAHAMMRRALARRGLTLQSSFGVRMVDTWTPLFDLSDKEKCQRQTLAAEPRIDTVARLVADRRRTAWGRRALPPLLARWEYAHYPSQRATRHFSVTPQCTGCGRCARKCPAGAITMADGRPVWTKAQCFCCLGCLHRCPAFAIQYGRRTARHGQFVHPGTCP